MKIDKGFILKEIAGSYIVVTVGDKVKEFNGIVNLNETGASIWKRLEKETTMEELIEFILEEYEVDRETATKDVNEFVNKLREAGIIK